MQCFKYFFQCVFFFNASSVLILSPLIIFILFELRIFLSFFVFFPEHFSLVYFPQICFTFRWNWRLSSTFFLVGKQHNWFISSALVNKKHLLRASIWNNFPFKLRHVFWNYPIVQCECVRSFSNYFKSAKILWICEIKCLVLTLSDTHMCFFMSYYE